MSHGIFRHSFLKTFLTRGFLKPIFKSLLYKKEDHIHSDFVEVVNNFVVKIEQDIKPKNEILTIYWLSIVPKLFFEMIFIEDKIGRTYLNVVKNATQSKGEECAYITQAFILWNLQQILQNNQEYKKKMGFTINDLENIINIILGENNKVLSKLKKYRERFDLKKLGVDPGFVDPRDWPIIYVWDICDTLIDDKKVLKDTMQKWNDDVLKKMELITLVMHFIGEQTQISLKLAKV